MVSRGRYAGRWGQSFHPQFRRSIHHQLRRLYRRHAHYRDRRRRRDRILLVGGKLQMGQVDHEKGYWLRERRGWNLIGCFYIFNQYSGVEKELFEGLLMNPSNTMHHVNSIYQLLRQPEPSPKVQHMHAIRMSSFQQFQERYWHSLLRDSTRWHNRWKI